MAKDAGYDGAMFGNLTDHLIGLYDDINKYLHHKSDDPKANGQENADKKQDVNKQNATDSEEKDTEKNKDPEKCEKFDALIEQDANRGSNDNSDQYYYYDY